MAKKVRYKKLVNEVKLKTFLKTKETKNIKINASSDKPRRDTPGWSS